jgi:hypothetical protein
MCPRTVTIICFVSLAIGCNSRSGRDRPTESTPQNPKIDEPEASGERRILPQGVSTCRKSGVSTTHHDKIALDIKETSLGKYHSKLIVSPDCRRVAYAEKRGVWDTFVVVDGVEGKHYEFFTPEIAFSPDGKRVGYVASPVHGKAFPVIDGVEGPGYEADLISGPYFSPDSKRVRYAGRRGGKWMAVVDGREEVAFDEVAGNWTFSPDSKRLAFAGRRGDRCLVVVDGAEGKAWDAIVNGPVFSPDSKHVAYAAKRGGEEVAVVDGVEGQACDGVEGLDFSCDGRRLLSCVRHHDKVVLVVDGVEGNEYDKFLGSFSGTLLNGKVVVKSTTLVLDTATSFHALAVRNGEVFRVEAAIVAE